MAAVLVFSSDRVQSAVGHILGVRWPQSGNGTLPRNTHGYAVKKWVMPRPQRLSCWTTCIRDQLTLEEPARTLARSFRGPLLLFPFAAGALVVAPPDVPNAYAVSSVEMLERHLCCTLSGTQRDELHALLFDDHHAQRLRWGPLTGEIPGRAEAVYADRFVNALRQRRSLPAPDADLFGVGGGIYFTASGGGGYASSSSSSSSEGSPQRNTSSTSTGSILATLRAAESAATSGGASVCSICRSNRASICLLPCQHQCLCDDCARTLCEHNEQPTCPLCRVPVESAVRPFV